LIIGVLEVLTLIFLIVGYLHLKSGMLTILV